MDVSIRRHNVEVGEELRAIVEEKVTHLARFLEGLERAEVRFSQERNPRITDKEVCEVTIAGRGHVVRARAAAADTQVAVDRVIDKLEHRMEKLKGRLVARSRSHPRHHGAPGPRTPTSGWVDVEADGEPRIVKVKQFAIKPMTPEEASLQMELLSHGFFFFTNAETGRAAVVYRRRDGHIGLIDAT